MIPLYYDKGSAFVWNADDWYELRTKHRICGALVGALPSHPRQNAFLGLPMLLMPEEAALLLEENICELYELLDLKKDLTEEQKQEYDAYQKRLLEEQKVELKKRRIEQFKEKIDVIIAGKRKKMKVKGMDDTEIILDKETLIQEEMNRDIPLLPSNELVYIPLEHQWESEKKKMCISDLKPSVLEGEGRVRFGVYKDLWRKGHHITAGYKFGADFLVYPGDPFIYHAMYMVRCVLTESTIMRPSDIVAFGRLSVTVSKLAVLACHDEDENTSYQTLQWHDSVK